MTFRHAAALALVGWYLMLPPPNPRAFGGVDDDAPIVQWKLFDSYDSAMECKMAAERMVASGDSTGVVEAQLKQARCIATDDPRLKEK